MPNDKLRAGEAGDTEKIENLLSEKVLDAAIEVHRTLGGPGLLESLYEDALFHELRIRGIPALSQVQIPVTYKNCRLRDPMRLDIIVNIIDFFVIKTYLLKIIPKVLIAQKNLI